MCFSVFSFLTVRKNTSGRRGNLMGTTVEHRIPDSMLVVPVTTIAQQFKVECDRLGISALLGSEVNLTADF